MHHVKKTSRVVLWLSAAIAGIAASANAAALTVLAPGHTWEYTFTDPTGDSSWNTTTGVGGDWASGPAPFGSGGASPEFAPGTLWPADGDFDDDLWVRTAIDLSGVDLALLRWDLGVDNGFKLYANGTLVASDNAEGFTFRWEYSGGFGSALLPGVNVIAVALEDHGGLTAFDMQITTIPLPAAAGLFILGLAGLVRRRVYLVSQDTGHASIPNP